MSAIVEFNSQSVTTEDERKDIILQMLQEGVCTVTFTKVDGETRVMPCTLDSSLMPARTVAESKTVQRAFKPSTLSVWCTDASEWRSFRIANVTRVEKIV